MIAETRDAVWYTLDSSGVDDRSQRSTIIETTIAETCYAVRYDDRS